MRNSCLCVRVSGSAPGCPSQAQVSQDSETVGGAVGLSLRVCGGWLCFVPNDLCSLGPRRGPPPAQLHPTLNFPQSKAQESQGRE